MKNKAIGIGLAVAAVLIIVVVLVMRAGGGRQTPIVDQLWAGPIKLRFNPQLKEGVISSLDGREITEADLLARSKLLEELATNETKLLLRAIHEKVTGAGKSSAKVELFRPMPSPSFDAKLVSGLDVTFSPRRGDDVLAKIDGAEVRREDLPLNQIRFSEVSKAHTDEILSLLKGIYIRQLLLQKAKEAGTDIEGFISANIIEQDPPVTDEDIDRFATENGIVPPPKEKGLRARLSAIIADKRRSQAIDEYAKVNFADKVGEIALTVPQFTIPVSETQAVIEQRKTKGASTVFVFGNFACSNCAQVFSDLVALRGDLKDSVRIGFIHLFSAGDWRSRLAAESSQCLNDQGHDYFWSFATQAAREGEQLSEARIYELVKTTGADFPKFQQCLLSQSHKKEIDERVKYATELGVSRVPTIIVGSEILTGNITRQQIMDKLKAQQGANTAGWFTRK